LNNQRITLRINDRWRKSSAGKSFRTTLDRKWQWLMIIEESSRDKRELNQMIRKERFFEGGGVFYFSKFIRTVRSDCVKWINGNKVINWHEFERFFSLSKVVKRLEIDGAVIFNIPRVPDWFDRVEVVRCDENSGCWCDIFNKGNWNIVEFSDSLALCVRKSWHDAKFESIGIVFKIKWNFYLNLFDLDSLLIE
jgi:hypothetical protein